MSSAINKPAAIDLARRGRRKRGGHATNRRKGLRRLTLERLESRNLLSVSGNVRTDEIFPAGDVDDFDFFLSLQDLDAAGGQYIVTLAVSGGLDAFQPRVRFEAPGGSLLGSEIDAGDSRTFTLTDAGNYKVRVGDNDNRDVGMYALALEGIAPPSLDAQEIELGDLRSERLDVMGQVDAYTFTAAAGDRVTLSLSESHAGSRATLFSPLGDQVKLYSSSTGTRVSQVTPGSKVRSEPLNAGTYVIQVHDNSYRAVGDYQLALEGLVPASEDAVELTLDETATGEILAGEIDTFSFAAQGDEILTLSLSDLVSGSSSRLWAELYSPSGTKVPKLPGTNGPSEVENGAKVVYQLPAEAGTYVIQVYDYDYTHPEAYGVTLSGLNPPGPAAAAIAFGQAQTGTIDAPSDADTFYVTLSAAELAATGGSFQATLSLASETTVDYKPRAQMFGPAGEAVGQELSAGDTKSLMLTQAGTYTIQVYDNDYTHTKDELIDRGKDPQYTVLLADAQPPAVGGVAVSAQLLADAQAGPAKFAVTVVFNETMDTSVLPTLGFSVTAVAGGTTPTLTNPSPVWYATAVTDDTVTVTYDVVDRDLSASNIALTVSGGTDLAGNVQAAYTLPSAFSVDTRNPRVSRFTPLDNAVRVAPDTNLVMAFAEAVEKRSGSILIKRTADQSLVETIAVEGSQVTLAEGTVTIVPAAPLEETTGYYVEVSPGAFRDLAGNDFVGIQDSTTWNFTTGDFTPPAVVRLAPADAATGVAWDTDLEIEFDEPIRAGAGQITIKRSSNDAVVEAIPVTAEQVAISGTQVVVALTGPLADNSLYYVEISSGAIEDLAGNGFVGISGSAGWSFTTLDAPPSVLATSPSDGAVGVLLPTSLQLTFDQPVRKGLGEILVKRVADDSTFQTISVADDRVVVSDRLASIQLAPMLERRTDYYVEMAPGVFEDFTANPFAGFSGSEAWNFATVGPIALDDVVTTAEDVPLEIAVLSNDSSVGRPVDGTSLTIVAAPSFGTADVQAGLVVYTPAANYAGPDTFQYTVNDSGGYQSNVATVVITVIAVPDYQNPDLPEDVNRSGAVTPLDVLIGINRINGYGNQLPPDPIPPAIPLYYYDVDGNGFLEPLDLLRIINHLNQASTPGEGESSEVAVGGVPLLAADQAEIADHWGASAEAHAPATALPASSPALPNRPWPSLFLQSSPERHDTALAAWERQGEDPYRLALDEILSLVLPDVAQAASL